jgi:heptosyltransferase III
MRPKAGKITDSLARSRESELRDINSALQIAIFRGGALGDIVLTLPILQALKDHYPGCLITLVAPYPQAVLARDHADRIIDLNSARLVGLFNPEQILPDEVREELRANLILSYLSDPARIIEQKLASSAAVKFLQGSFRLDLERRPAVEQLSQPLRDLGISSIDPVPRLTASRSTRPRSIPNPASAGCNSDFAQYSKTPILPPATLRVAMRAGHHCASPDSRTRTRTKRLVSRLAIHPGSGSPKKNWPLDHWAALLGELISSFDEVLLISGEADADVAEKIRPLVPMAKLRRCACRSLWDLVSELSQATLFIGHDSGVTHVAAAAGVRTVALFGPTDPAIWAPNGDRVIVIKSTDQTMSGLSVETVLEKLSYRSKRS